MNVIQPQRHRQAITVWNESSYARYCYCCRRPLAIWCSTSIAMGPPVSLSTLRNSSRMACRVVSGSEANNWPVEAPPRSKGPYQASKDGNTNVCFSLVVSKSTKPAAVNNDFSKASSPSAKRRATLEERRLLHSCEGMEGARSSRLHRAQGRTGPRAQSPVHSGFAGLGWRELPHQRRNKYHDQGSRHAGRLRDHPARFSHVRLRRRQRWWLPARRLRRVNPRVNAGLDPDS